MLGWNYRVKLPSAGVGYVWCCLCRGELDVFDRVRAGLLARHGLLLKVDPHSTCLYLQKNGIGTEQREGGRGGSAKGSARGEGRAGELG